MAGGFCQASKRTYSATRVRPLRSHRIRHAPGALLRDVENRRQDARCWPKTTSASGNELRRIALQLRLHGLSISPFMTIQWPGMVNNRRWESVLIAFLTSVQSLKSVVEGIVLRSRLRIEPAPGDSSSVYRAARRLWSRRHPCALTPFSLS